MLYSFAEIEPFLREAMAAKLEKIASPAPGAKIDLYLRSLFAGDKRSFLSCKGNGKTAAAELHPLAWDSTIYGLEIGSIGFFFAEEGISFNQHVELAAEVKELAGQRGLRLVIARAELSDGHWIRALETVGFRLMDVQASLVWRSGVAPPNTPSTGVEIRDYRPDDFGAIGPFASEAFSQSHLYSDQRLPLEQTDRLHQEWIRNDCAGRASFVLVAVEQGSVVGFVAGLSDSAKEEWLGLAQGHIDLIAVDPQKRKGGMGRALMHEALMRYKGRDVAYVSVSTQATNLSAIKLYQGLGFQLNDFAVTLHAWIDSPAEAG
ncbi:MAG: GNAT family N-acetyltransferase [Verrucomicrobiota bacterium]|nr:GNAT family N-acetyltransferase [Verrucomicrobiota bacterium]